MSISAFTFARNADKLYYPIQASIQSALPLVDEFIVALGDSDADDKTLAIIEGMNDARVKIFKRNWDASLFKNTKIFAHEADFGLSQCQGEWCLHLQADEVLHEDDWAVIKEACHKYAGDKRVDGMLFDFVHFWGDYNHVMRSHNFHPREIRLVRNHIGVSSYLDSISFRKANNEKLNVVKLPVRIFHYGYVRPPKIMGAKSDTHNRIYQGVEPARANDTGLVYDWGPIGGLEIFKGTHPAVMRAWMQQFNWGNSLNYNKPGVLGHWAHQHLRLKYRLLSWIENNLNGGEQIFGYKNYNLIKG
jgi:hypothetical protein